MASEIYIAKESGAKANNAISPTARRALDLLSVSNSKYNDASKITVGQTPMRNWRLYYDGKDTGLTVGRNNFRAEDLDDDGMLIR